MRKRYVLAITIVLLATGYYFCLPAELFSDPYSAVLYSREGHLLSASVASDGQWRFPSADTISSKFITALTCYEDKRFFSHIGVDPLALGRALRQNLTAGSVVSGGSTLTMQTIRLSRKGKSRTIVEKLIELVLATRLELRMSKSEVLNLYATHAPFGGNVVGLEAACWRYFGRSMQDLSWGEAALLAVLPNAPSLMHPGKNRALLMEKRNTLLDKLHTLGVFDTTTCLLAKAEPIPDKPATLPRLAHHLLQQVPGSSPRLQSTLHYQFQMQAEWWVARHAEQLLADQIHNAAALVLDTKTGEVLAYVGNVTASGSDHGNSVDVITSPRSTGSILKPVLYAAMLDEGKMLRTSLVADVPTYLNGFAPRNFSRQFDGVVPANEALIRSLNVPAVELLREYRYEKLHTLLTQLGMRTLTQPPDHYGLSLILGGAEGTLWDITGLYATLGRLVNCYAERPGSNRYSSRDLHAPSIVPTRQNGHAVPLEKTSLLSAASVYQTLAELTEVYRPGEETGWRNFSQSKKIAWKTGTSYGFRDGWAVGVTPEYTVGVWVGNADGEGRPGLTGTDAAAPLLFSLFSMLPATTWFNEPAGEMRSAAVCRASGNRASELCVVVDTVSVTEAGLRAPACTHHRQIHLTSDRRERVSSLCYPVADMITQTWFVLPPVQEYYASQKLPWYRPLPPLRQGCEETRYAMDLIYPKHQARLFIPRELNGKAGVVLFQLAHGRSGATVFWHLDQEYVGTTQGRHQLPLTPASGTHTLTLVDDQGNTLSSRFEIVSGR